MAEVKNTFLKSRMNKGLDDRILPNNEYRNAVNVSINKSEGDDIGSLQTVLGNELNFDFTTLPNVPTDVQVIGIYPDETNTTVYAFLTNNTEESYNQSKNNYVVSLNVSSGNSSIILEGNWLNFSTQFPMYGINLLEELLFFTDNRNQPRKINVTNSSSYYTEEHQISVAKYYPLDCIELFKTSADTGAVIDVPISTSTVVVDSEIITLVSQPSNLILGSGVTGTGVLQNTYVTAVGVQAADVLPVLTANQITVNQKQTLASGTALTFSSVETTMYDVVNQFLPNGPQTTEDKNKVGTVTSSTVFNQTNANLLGYSDITGLNIYKYDPSTGVYTIVNDTAGNPVVIASFQKATSPPTIEVTLEAPGFSGTSIDVGDDLYYATRNPYYDSGYLGDPDYLEDKFVRFSYRFKFDDGEFSLIAPFTQPAFIPQQDGYFIYSEDEQKASRSTEVAFMQNKVNKILLQVPLPCSAANFQSEYKVDDIEILYKESNSQVIKVVDSVPVNFTAADTGYFYEYEYGSKDPYKTLPSKETVRVYDKVPVKALTQEVISNRVVYGNYQDKHTPPGFLNYIATSGAKGTFNPLFKQESEIEYPNSTLKQNRTYQVGVVLADKVGRQSTVILSETTNGGVISYLGSTTYSPYRNEFSNPPVQDFDGNSLKIDFKSVITATYPDSPGLYNSDVSSASYNPLGWYSYKVVVKQTEQDYYNSYLPGLFVGYPTDPATTREENETTHITLINDNINKIPRDLSEVGPTQKQFRSSVEIFNRVSGDGGSSIVFFNQAYFPARTGDVVSAIGTISDLFDTLPPSTSALYPSFYDQDSDPLIGRVSTNKSFLGLQANINALVVYEVEPQVSLLDIYWETSTSGLISDLNTLIENQPSPGFASIAGWSWDLNENDVDGFIVVSDFFAQDISSTLITDTTVSFLVEDGAGNNISDKFEVVAGTGGAGSGRHTLKLINNNQGFTGEPNLVFQNPINLNNFTFFITFTDNRTSFPPGQDEPFPNATFQKIQDLVNTAASLDPKDPVDPLPFSGAPKEFSSQAQVQAFTGVNGSSTFTNTGLVLNTGGLTNIDLEWYLDNGEKSLNGGSFSPDSSVVEGNALTGAPYFFLVDGQLNGLPIINPSTNLNTNFTDLNRRTHPAEDIPEAVYRFDLNIKDAATVTTQSIEYTVANTVTPPSVNPISGSITASSSTFTSVVEVPSGNTPARKLVVTTTNQSNGPQTTYDSVVTVTIPGETSISIANTGIGAAQEGSEDLPVPYSGTVTIQGVVGATGPTPPTGYQVVVSLGLIDV
tara:strand:- start:2682 stop:6542 length:3861 start_codon:yes stop_codon:yes gene_type:complete